jgi:2',3'-cyclic-nucleotide 2'-phosphodiesterase
MRREKEVSNFEKERELELEKIALLSKDEARQIIISELEKTLHFRKAKMIKKYEEEIRDDSRKIAKEIIVSAIQKCAADHTSTSTVSIVELPNDDIKGRIIGKDGRNIRSLEMCTGVQIIVDDTPESITISAFDPVRRAIAKLALEKLIEDR